jgi:hypothetical protein
VEEGLRRISQLFKVLVQRLKAVVFLNQPLYLFLESFDDITVFVAFLS